MSLNDFLKSNDINYLLYAIFIIKKYLEDNDNSEKAIDFLISQLNCDYMILLTSLFNKGNKKLSYCLLYILISIGYMQTGEELFILDEKIVLNIAMFLDNNKNEKILLYNGILLIKNLSFNEKICEILLRYKILDFFEAIYERNILDADFMRILMNCINNFINYVIKMHKIKKNKEFLCLLPCIKIIKNQLRPNYSVDLLFKYIYKLYEIACICSSEIFYEMINCKIHNEIMNIYPIIIQHIEELKNNIKLYENIYSNKNKEDDTINHINNEEYQKYKKNVKDLDVYKQICLIILKILGKLMSKEDGILTQNLLDSGIANFLTNVIQSHEVRVIKNAAFCISNICAGTCGQIGYLLKNNTILELIKVSKNIYDALDYNEKNKNKNEYFCELKDALREINFVFSLTIENCLFEKTIPLVRFNNYTIILVLLKGLNVLDDKNNEDLFINILKAFYKLISFDRTDNNNSNNNEKFLSFTEILERNGFKETLAKLQSSENIILSTLAFRMHDALFNDFEKNE